MVRNAMVLREFLIGRNKLFMHLRQYCLYVLGVQYFDEFTLIFHR